MTHWTWVEPLDVWMFRDNKPFSAGQNFVARSIFPPTPQTMQGVVRTAYLEHRGVNWAAYNAGKADPKLYDAVGNARSLGALRVSGPFLARRTGDRTVERLYPAPLDLLIHRDADPAKVNYQIMAPQPLTFATTCPFDGWQPVMLPPDVTGFSDISDGWLTETQFQAYLNDDAAKIAGEPLKSGDLYVTEERPGVGLDYRRRAADEANKLLYHAQFIRPCAGVGLLVGTSIDAFHGVERVRIGGEGRGGRVHSVDYTPPTPPTSGLIKLVLLTPAYFDGGWGPKDGDWSPWVGDQARLIAFAIGKPQALSGWDLANNQPKPLRHFIPAGSVYYFADAERTDQPFTQTPPNEPDFGAMGFGNFAVGSWHTER